MNIRKEIKNRINKIEHVNRKKTESYKKGLEQRILSNLQMGKPAQDQKVLYSKYCNAKPKQLTQMQQAMQEAVQCLNHRD